MLIALKAKILLTILFIVLMFTFFGLFYFPAQQGKLLLKSYNNEIQNLANTVSLGVKIALTEQNYTGVQTAMAFVKDDPRLQFIAVVQRDTVWNSRRSRFTIKESVINAFPEKVRVNPAIKSNDKVIVKRSPFHTPALSGAILLVFSTDEIIESKKEIRTTALIVGGVFFLLASLIGVWLARNISVPVLALRNAAIRVGEGDLAQRVQTSSHDEIEQLGKAFNKMVQDLAKTRKELSEANQSLSLTNAALNDALLELKTTQAQLIQNEKMASLGELTAGIAHEIQNPLNFVNNFSEVNKELIQEVKEELEAGNEKEVLAILDSMVENLERIMIHGHRADSIVKGMLQHSRASTGEKQPTEINALAEEYLRLAYHGLRAKDKDFNACMVTDFDPEVGKVNIVPQEIGRVILNLLNNAFYATSQKKMSLNGQYEPEVKVSTKRLNGKVEISVRDNGNGIADQVKSKIFQPFFTTKPSGQGTGLGLSLSYDIVTKGHGGQMLVNTKVGEFAEFIIVLSQNSSPA